MKRAHRSSPSPASRLLACTIALATSALAVDARAQDVAPMPPGAPVMPGAAPAAPAASGQMPRGFTVETHLGTSLLFAGTTGGTLLSLSNLGGGFLIGYKIDRFIFGLGFDLSRTGTGSTTQVGANSTSTSRDNTLIQFLPGVRIAILRSADQRVELFGQLDIGLGGRFEDRSPPPMTQPTTSNFHLSYNIGPGIRFWAHPQFAIAAATGVHGDYDTDSESSTTAGVTTTKTDTSLLTSIFASLQLLAVF